MKPPLSYWSYPTQQELYPNNDFYEPVPGWGMDAALIAGPARVGVGQMPMRPRRVHSADESPYSGFGQVEPRRYWPWFAAAAAIGGGVALAYNMGWVAKLKRKMKR